MQRRGKPGIRCAMLKKHKTLQAVSWVFGKMRQEYVKKWASNIKWFQIVCPSWLLFIFLNRCFEEQAQCSLKPWEYFRDRAGSLGCVFNRAKNMLCSWREVGFSLPGWALVFSFFMHGCGPRRQCAGCYQNLRGPREWLEYYKLKWGRSCILAVSLPRGFWHSQIFDLLAMVFIN